MANNKKNKKGKKSKSNAPTFADRAKQIKNKYGKRVDQGDARAIASMERELNELFKEQETIKQQMQLEQQMNAYNQIAMAYGGKMLYGDGGNLPEDDYSNYYKNLVYKFMALGDDEATAAQKANLELQSKIKKDQEINAIQSEITTDFDKRQKAKKDEITAIQNEIITNSEKKQNAKTNSSTTTKPRVKNERVTPFITYMRRSNPEPFTAPENTLAGVTEDGKMDPSQMVSTSASNAPVDNSGALSSLDYLNYGVGMATPAIQLARTINNKPDRQSIFYEDYLDLPEYYNTEGYNAVDRNLASTKESLLESGQYDPYGAIAVQTAADNSASKIAQGDASINFQNKVQEGLTNAQTHSRNIERMNKGETDYRMDLAAYNDMINTYIGNLGSNVVGIGQDIQNRQTVDKMYPNYGVNARSKNN